MCEFSTLGDRLFSFECIPVEFVVPFIRYAWQNRVKMSNNHFP